MLTDEDDLLVWDINAPFMHADILNNLKRVLEYVKQLDEVSTDSVNRITTTRVLPPPRFEIQQQIAA